MELKLDLHIHSQRSPDGIMTLDEIVSLAKARGLDGAAVVSALFGAEDVLAAARELSALSGKMVKGSIGEKRP